MRVFILGSGRCGTKTFANACRGIRNYTSRHETRNHVRCPAGFEYPDNHIEIDGGLSYFLHTIAGAYAGSYYVFLYREPQLVAKSFAHRMIYNNQSVTLWPVLDRHFFGFQLGAAKKYCGSNTDELARLLTIWYENMIVGTLTQLESIGVDYLSFTIEEAPNYWDEFCDALSADCDRAACKRELLRRTNSSFGKS